MKQNSTHPRTVVNRNLREVKRAMLEVRRATARARAHLAAGGCMASTTPDRESV